MPALSIVRRFPNLPSNLDKCSLNELQLVINDVVLMRSIFKSYTAFLDMDTNYISLMADALGMTDEDTYMYFDLYNKVIKTNAEFLVKKVYSCALYLDTMYYALLAHIRELEGDEKLKIIVQALADMARKYKIGSDYFIYALYLPSNEDIAKSLVIARPTLVYNQIRARAEQVDLVHTFIAFYTVSVYIFHHIPLLIAVNGLLSHSRDEDGYLELLRNMTCSLLETEHKVLYEIEGENNENDESIRIMLKKHSLYPLLAEIADQAMHDSSYNVHEALRVLVQGMRREMMRLEPLWYKI